jgi:hypothetical protein
VWRPERPCGSTTRRLVLMTGGDNDTMGGLTPGLLVDGPLILLLAASATACINPAAAPVSTLQKTSLLLSSLILLLALGALPLVLDHQRNPRQQRDDMDSDKSCDQRSPAKERVSRSGSVAHTRSIKHSRHIPALINVSNVPSGKWAAKILT